MTINHYKQLRRRGIFSRVPIVKKINWLEAYGLYDTAAGCSAAATEWPPEPMTDVKLKNFEDLMDQGRFPPKLPSF